MLTNTRFDTLFDSITPTRWLKGGFTPASLFTQGEQGVWYDPSDLTYNKVTWRRNLLTYSENFENAAWTKSNASILSNLALYSQDFDNAAWANQVAGTGVAPTRTANFATAPDGTMTADRLQFSLGGGTTTADFSYIAQAIIPLSIVHTGSFYVKLNSGTADIYVRTGNGSATYTVTSSWTRVEVACTAANTSSQFAIGLRGGQTPANTNTADILVWGAQLVPGSTAQTYTRSLATAAPIMFVDPFGETQADKLIENTANNTHRLLPSSPPSGTAGLTYTFSVYVKAAERTFCLIDAFAGTAESYVYVNLSTGAAGSNSGTYTIVDAGNGWYRVTATVLANGTAGLSLNVFPTTSSTGTGLTYLGDGTSGIYVYGAQVEQSSTVSLYQKITDFNSEFLAAFPTHSLYQDSVGTTAVTSLGQSVGLVADKRLGGLAGLGSERITNGDFSDGATGWTFYGTAPGWSIVGGRAECTSTAAGNRWIQSTGSLVIGRTYLVSVDAVITAGSIIPDMATSPTPATTSGKKQWIVVATTTTFQIMANTTFIGTIDNISVREVPGNHAIQATSLNRPTLQARSNLLTYSEQFDNAAWTKTDATVTANATSAPDGTLTADALVTSVTSNPNVQQALTGPQTNITLTLSFWAKAGTTSEIIGSLYINSGLPSPFITVTGAILSGPGAVDSSGATGGAIRFTGLSSTEWTRVRVTGTPSSTSGNFAAYIKNRLTGSQIGDTAYIWGAQLEQSSTATTYQRVTTAADYQDINLPRSLEFNGSTHSLATAGNVDFSATDKVTLFSGLFKASDAAQGIVTELTASAALNTGAFNIQAPSATPGTNRYAFESKGSVLATANVTNAIYAAPRTDVVTMQSAISTDALDGRINGTSVATSATDQGTGNFSNALVYIGRRGGSSLPFNGRLFQLIIRGATTTTSAIQAAEKWIASKTGITI